MKKMMVLFLACIMIFSLAACGGEGGGEDAASAPKADAIEWKFASIYPNPTVNPEFSSLASSQEYFCQIVGERSGGRLVITPFYDGVLGTTNELFEQTKNGELEVYLGQPMSSYDSRFAAWSIPYLFKDFEEIRAVACDPEGDIYKMAHEWLAEQNMELVGIGVGNIRGFINSKREVRTIDDLKDMKVRTYQDPIVTAFWSEICNASPLPMSEVYTSLQTKAIDGLEFAGGTSITQKFYEVTSYYSNIDWQWNSGANFLVSKKAFDALPDDLKEIVRQCGIEAANRQSDIEMEDYDKARDALEERGVAYYELTDAERQTFIDYARTTDTQVKEFVGEDIFNAMFEAVETHRAGQ